MKYEVLIGKPGEELSGFVFAVDADDGDELTAAFRAGIIAAGQEATDVQVLCIRSEKEWGYT